MALLLPALQPAWVNIRSSDLDSRDDETGYISNESRPLFLAEFGQSLECLFKNRSQTSVDLPFIHFRVGNAILESMRPER